MKKRLLCMTLGLIMVLSVLLAGCSNSNGDEEDGTEAVEVEGAQTVTMWVITDERTTEEAMNAVEEAFTKITKSKYKINVDIQFYTEDEYYQALEESINKSVEEQELYEEVQRALRQAIRDAQAQGITDEVAITNQFYKDHPEYERFRDWDSDEEEETGEVEEETIINDYGIAELKYPDTEPYQVDIIYLSGYERYLDYIEKEWLAPLDEELSGSSKKLNDVISASLLGGVMVDGATYAIPNNVAIGEYKYMMLDKELFDKYYYNYSDITDILDCADFLADIKKLEPNVVPIDATFEECMNLFVWYWTLNAEKYQGDDIDENGNPVTEYKYTYNTDNIFSICGAVYQGPEYRNRGDMVLSFDSLFTLPEYREIFMQLMEYKYNGYYGEVTEGQTAAVSFMTGDYTVKQTIEENKGVYTDEETGKQYYGIVVEYPEADEQDLYGNMFSVYGLSSHLSGSMKIITALNTNAELRNLLQYGIEGTHYEISEDGVLHRLNNDYMMDIEKTGNCFIAYPEEGLPSNYWEIAKLQNNEALINPLLGFSFDNILAESDGQLDNGLIENVNILSQQTLEKINACQTYEELDELVNTTTDGLADSLRPSRNPTIIFPGFDDPVVVNLNKYCNNAYDPSSAEGGEDTSGESPYTVYYNWLSTYGYLPAS